eukprot:TRINITY_DN55366_c0_g1_i1.p1 TRINITY_DN55366_c0_g1~~TRINITY_DN55366_c0_g1_i1.p1  ORF type:complete len:315 (-),score=34.98 TRINITY_DN55366_c0_g1_i1:139-1050(-)
MAAEGECRICYESRGKLISPCLCRGSQRYVHLECLEAWHSEENNLGLQCTSCNTSYTGDGIVELARKMWEKAKASSAGQTNDDCLFSANQLACKLVECGEMREAEQIYRDVCDMTKTTYGEEHPNALIAQSNLGSHLTMDFRGSEAMPILKQVFDAQKRLRGAEHADTMATANALAVCLTQCGEHSDAIRMHRENADLYNRVLGADHPDSIVCQYNVALSHRALGEFPEAAEALKEVLERRQRVLGTDHPLTRETAAVIGNLGKERIALYVGMALPPLALLLVGYGVFRLFAYFIAGSAKPEL